MKERELRRLSRADLLEMLIDQSRELQELREKLAQTEAELKKREIAISNAGSIAEASLMLNGVFEAAQAACREYVENTQKFCERRESALSCSDEPAAGISGSENCAGMPYAQYLKQNAPSSFISKSPVQSTAELQSRTARYRSVMEGQQLE